MLNTLIKTALNNRLIVIGLACATIVYGYMAVNSLPVDVFPELTKPTITVMTEAHGRAPEEVETLITIPLEYSLKGIPGIDRIRSTSGVGLSVIYLEFSWDTDLYTARQLVGERINLSKSRLPDDAEPFMAPVSSLMGQIQQIAISTENSELTPIEIRTIADWTIRPRLMTIPGVSQVLSIGGGQKQYQILISAEKLNQYQQDLDDVEGVLKKISRNTSGGFYTDGTKEVLVRNIGAASSIEEIKKTVVGLHFGRPVYIENIAEVKVGAKVKRGDGSYNGKPAVIMVIQKQPEGDTLAITKRVDEVIAEVRSDLPQDLVINTDVFKQSRFIETSISGVRSKLIWGSGLVFIVLLIFLANLKISVVTLTAIPLSFFVTFIIFRWFGLTINTMTLGGLAIAIGELVDDSIVDVENIFRRLKENLKKGSLRSTLKIVYEASSEVRNSIVLATVIIALVFLPLFQLSGLEGRLFTPLAIAYLTALISSLLVSLTVTPVLSSFILKNLNSSSEEDPAFLKWLKDCAKRALMVVMHHPKRLVSVVIILFVIAVVFGSRLGRDFLPKFNEGTAMIAIFSSPGVSLDESNRVGLLAETKILEVPEVKSVSRRTGRAEGDEHAMGVNVSEIDVDFKVDIDRSREEILSSIREKLNEIPNIGVNVGQPISHLMDHTLSGVSAQIAIKIFGDDLGSLRLMAAELKGLIGGVPGLVDLQVEQQGLIPQLKVYALSDEAAKYNMSAGQITSLLESAYNGHRVGTVIEGQKFFDLFYRYDSSSRSSIKGINATILRTMPDGQKVKVYDVADVYKTTGPNQISREDGLRRIVISGNVSGKDLLSVISEIRELIDGQLELPKGYFVTYGGQFQAQQAATRKIIGFGILALIGIFLILITHFKSISLASQVMLTVPFSFIGGVAGLVITGETLSVASLVGFITLCGISSRNGIMMISHYLHLLKHEGETFTQSMVVRGSLERLTPVLMTAIVASMALMPIALSAGQPGSEILHPVAVVIIGGLMSSTLLDVLVTPTIFFNYGRLGAERYLAASQKESL